MASTLKTMFERILVLDNYWLNSGFALKFAMEFIDLHAKKTEDTVSKRQECTTFCFAAIMQGKFRRDVHGHGASHNVGDCGQTGQGEHTASVEGACHTKRVHCCAVVSGNLDKIRGKIPKIKG